MGCIFVSFSQQDTHDMAWRIVDYLSRHGRDALNDMDMFGAGDFRESIREAVGGAAAFATSYMPISGSLSRKGWRRSMRASRPGSNPHAASS